MIQRLLLALHAFPRRIVARALGLIALVDLGRLEHRAGVEAAQVLPSDLGDAAGIPARLRQCRPAETDGDAVGGKLQRDRQAVGAGAERPPISDERILRGATAFAAGGPNLRVLGHGQLPSDDVLERRVQPLGRTLGALIPVAMPDE